MRRPGQIMIAVCLALGLPVAPAIAGGDSGFRMGADFSSVRADIVEDDQEVKSTSQGFRLAAGWRFNQYLSLEFDYAESLNHDWIGGDDGTGQIEQSGVRLIGRIPVTADVAAVGMVGANRWTARETDRTGRGLNRINETDYTGGLGIEGRVSDSVVVRGTIEAVGDRAEVGAIMIGFRAGLR